MKSSVTLLLILPLLLASAACGGKTDTPLPRREAYPRLEAYADSFVRAEVPPVFPINSAALTEVERRDDGSYWLTASYPRYGASLFCTFTPVGSPKDKSEVIDNRLRRISLNLGDIPIDAEQTRTGDYTSYLVTTPTLSATPVQFLIYPDGDTGWVVSGSVFFPGIRPDTPLDSISPAIEAMASDVRRSLAGFRP